MNNPE